MSWRLLAAVLLIVGLYAATAVYLTHDHAAAPTSAPPRARCTPPFRQSDAFLVAVNRDTGERVFLCVYAAANLLVSMDPDGWSALRDGGISGLNGTTVVGRTGVFTINGRMVGR